MGGASSHKRSASARRTQRVALLGRSTRHGRAESCGDDGPSPLLRQEARGRGPGRARASLTTEPSALWSRRACATVMRRYRRSKSPSWSPERSVSANKAVISSLRSVRSPAARARARSASTRWLTATGTRSPTWRSRDVQRSSPGSNVSSTPDVTPASYDKHMSDTGLTFLLRLIFAAADDCWLDARDHTPLHRGLSTLMDRVASDDAFRAAWSHARLPVLRIEPDAEVGRRARGVTPALWELAAEGSLVTEAPGLTAGYAIAAGARTAARRAVLRLDPTVVQAVDEVSGYLAACSTAEKTPRSAARSSERSRASKARMPRQAAVPGGRQRASARTSPA